ncbi:hypothetical protein [Agrobacterium tumefaciens]|uniref:hypothetical protein n=1 Tax=Agrobacterium tumefaciens TaxID=358 RepID=UPI001CBC1B76|nr:hypothetical protein [Agrobacterium tumefaciens]
MAIIMTATYLCPNARMYDHGSYDVGAVVGGTILGALIKGMANGSHSRWNTTGNYRRDRGFNGCHGVR